MNPYAYALIGLTALVAMIVGAVTFAVLRLAAAARDATRNASQRSETALLSAALEDALGRLRAQERASAARAEASERLSGDIVASLTSGLLVVGGDGAVRILNPAGQRLLGRPEEAVSVGYRQVLSKAGPLAAVIDECLATSRPILRRTISVPDLGAVSHLGVTVSPLFDAAHAPHGAICLFTDLTAVIELEDQLRLKDTLAELGELTAGLAHEFRNGLATIHGYARLIDPEVLPDAHRPYIAGIRQETEALGRVVANFLNFARPQSVAMHRVDLDAIARRAADEVRPEIEGSGGTIAVMGRFAEIEGDDVLLRQALLNLLRNAMDACQGTGRAPDIVIEGSLDDDQHVVRLAVHDNGPGVDPSVRDRVFRPFFTTRSGGTGLGLAIVQKVVVLHGGRITVGTSPRGGAAMQMTLARRAGG